LDDLDVHIEGSVSFDRDVRFHGKIEGDLTVRHGHILELHGHVVRDLIIEVGSSAIVYGVVGREVVNKGGAVLMNGWEPANPAVVLSKAEDWGLAAANSGRAKYAAVGKPGEVVMAEGDRQELEQLLRELAAFDAAKHDSPPSSHDPQEVEAATKRKASLLARIRELQVSLSTR